MARILVRPVLLVVITLSVPSLAGCGLFGGPYEQANEAITEANEDIAEHNQLFEEARGTYEDARETVESGEATTREATTREAQRITQARETMQEARGRLAEAQETLSEVQDLDVAPEIQEYAGLLSEEVEIRLGAEAAEIEFYEILEQDPTLAENREEAQQILTEAGDGYEEAGETHQRAQEISDANPELLTQS